MNSCERELLKDLLQQVHAVVSSIHNSYIRFFFCPEGFAMVYYLR